MQQTNKPERKERTKGIKVHHHHHHHHQTTIP